MGAWGQRSQACLGPGFLVHHTSPGRVNQDLLDSLFQGKDPARSPGCGGLERPGVLGRSGWEWVGGGPGTWVTSWF